MSTNIHFIATREIQVVRTRRITFQEISFRVWQTPTDVTHDIMRGDAIQGYKDYIISCSRDEQLPIYADDDYFGERAPIRYDVYNAGKEHIEEFEVWLKMCDEEGYTVRAEAW